VTYRARYKTILGVSKMLSVQNGWSRGLQLTNSDAPPTAIGIMDHHKEIGETNPPSTHTGSEDP
jgi:hypothetical protein